jgi:hypothetical protein
MPIVTPVWLEALGAEIAEMRDRAAETRAPQTQEGEEHGQYRGALG